MSDENVVDATVPPAEGKDTETGAEETADSSGVSLVEPEDAGEGGEIRELQARLRAVSAAYRQLQDEVEETKERLNRQAQFQREIQRGEILAKMFEPLNNLQRSLEVVKDPDGRKGLEVVIHQFMEAFRDLGLEMFSPDGMPFDPNFHEALIVKVHRGEYYCVRLVEDLRRLRSVDLGRLALEQHPVSADAADGRAGQVKLAAQFFFVPQLGI